MTRDAIDKLRLEIGLMKEVLIFAVILLELLVLRAFGWRALLNDAALALAIVVGKIFVLSIVHAMVVEIGGKGK